MSFDEMVGDSGVPSFDDMTGTQRQPPVLQGGVPSFEDMVSPKKPIDFAEGAWRQLPSALTMGFTDATRSAEIVLAKHRLLKNEYVGGRAPVVNIQDAKIRGETRDVWDPYGEMFGKPDFKPTEWTAQQFKDRDVKTIEDYIAYENELEERGYSLGGKVGRTLTDIGGLAFSWWATGGMKAAGTVAGKFAVAAMLRRKATTTMGKALIATGGQAAGSGLRAVGLSAQFADSILRRQVPKNMEIDDAANVTFDGDIEGWGTSIWKGSLDHFINVAVEDLGGELGKGFSKFAGPILQKTPFFGAIIKRMETKWLKGNPLKTAGDFAKKVSTVSGLHSTGGELGEEFMTATLQAVTSTQDFGANATAQELYGRDATLKERLVAGLTGTAKSLPEMIISFGLLGGGTRGLGVYVDRQNAVDQELQEEIDILDSMEAVDREEALKHMQEGVGGKKFKHPGLLKYITPKWKLLRDMGTEELTEKVTNAHTAFELEQKGLKKWMNTSIDKLKKEKDLTRLPGILKEEAGKEATWSGVKGEIFAMGEQAPSNVFTDDTGNKYFEKEGESGNTVEVHGKVTPDKVESVKSSQLTDYDLGMLKKSGASLEVIASASIQEAKDVVRKLEQKEAGDLGISVLAKDSGKVLKLDTELNAFAADVREGKAEPDVTKTKAHVLQNKLDGGDNPVHIMRDLLDTYEYAPDFLSKSEADIFNGIRSLTQSIRRRANEGRRAQGLKEIGDVDSYITHWLDRTVDAITDRTLETDDVSLRAMMINPTSKERTLKDLNSYFSKDLGKLLNQMVAFDLRDIHLLNPVAAAREELDMLVKKRMIPKSTAKEVRDYLKYDIGRAETPMDKAFDRAAAKASKLISQITRGRVVLDLRAAKTLSAVRRLGFMSGLGFRLKAPLRNLGQRMLLGDLYSTRAIAKGQLGVFSKKDMMPDPVTGEPIRVMDHIQQQPWYQLTVNKFEDTVDDIVRSTPRSAVGKGVQSFNKAALYAYSKSHESNVKVAALTGYHEWQGMYEASQDKNSDHYKLCERESIKRRVPIESLLTQESDMDWQIREAVRRTQWEYFSTSMPVAVRGQVSRAALQFQSWWMNYYTNHMASMLKQTTSGLNDKGRLLPKGGRARAFKGMGTIYTVGKVAEAAVGVSVVKFLITPVASGMSPIPQFLYNVAVLAVSDDEREQKRAATGVKDGFIFWLPYSLAARDVYGVADDPTWHTVWEMATYQKKEGKY